MAPETSGFVRQITFGLLALAATATEIAAVDGRPLLVSFGIATAWVTLAAGMSRLAPTPDHPGQMPPRFLFVLLSVLVLLPFVLEPMIQRLAGFGHALEMQMVFALRNLGLGLAAFATWRLCLRLACVVSLFLMLFAIAMTDHPIVSSLLGLYAVTGSVWLMSAYWTGLQRFFVHEAPVGVEVATSNNRFPRLTLLVPLGVIGCVLAMLAFAPKGAAHVLGQWLPTSGGTGDFSPYARGGTNDGDDEVQGENARSTGMVMSDTFLDSPLPSLYDMLSDMYGDPFKPKQQERAVALDKRATASERKKPPADNLRPNREFATTRHSPRRPRESADRAARALFEVQGRTPLHIRAAGYDTFDGLAWKEASLNLATCLLEKEPKSNWMHVQERKPPEIFALPETHQFKITAPTGIWLPTPPHLTRFRVGRVNQAAFFAWGPDRILRLAQRKTPAGIVVETECRTLDPQRLPTVEFPESGALVGANLPPDLSPDIRALAHGWAEGLPKGWPQIAAVLQHLRSEYLLDWTSQPPDDCQDPLGQFLLQSKRGPDYQFATAAAILLRILGYQTRLVTGFYVVPEHYDPVTRHTPVVQEDVHFWAEVQLPCGDWLVLEPTPGYEVLGPNLPLSQRIAAVCITAAGWAWDHAGPLAFCLLFFGCAYGKRQCLSDLIIGVYWHWFPGRSWQQCVGRALWLLEWRGRCCGQPRALSQTVPLWLRTTLIERVSHDAQLTVLARMAEWAAYASDLAPPWQRAEVQDVCRSVVDHWTLRHWRRMAAADRRSGL